MVYFTFNRCLYRAGVRWHHKTQIWICSLQGYYYYISSWQLLLPNYLFFSPSAVVIYQVCTSCDQTWHTSHVCWPANELSVLLQKDITLDFTKHRGLNWMLWIPSILTSRKERKHPWSPHPPCAPPYLYHSSILVGWNSQSWPSHIDEYIRLTFSCICCIYPFWQMYLAQCIYSRLTLGQCCHWVASAH